MTATVGLIVLTTIATSLLSWATLTTMAPWAIVSISLVGLFTLGRELHWFDA